MAQFVESENVRMQAAMLRLVMLLRREGTASAGLLVDRVARETGVDAARFRAYVIDHDKAVAEVLARSRGGGAR